MTRAGPGDGAWMASAPPDGRDAEAWPRASPPCAASRRARTGTAPGRPPAWRPASVPWPAPCRRGPRPPTSRPRRRMSRRSGRRHPASGRSTARPPSATRIARVPAGPPHATPPPAPDTSAPPWPPAEAPPWRAPGAAAGRAGRPARCGACGGRRSATRAHHRRPDQRPRGPDRCSPAPSGGPPSDHWRPPR